MWESRHGFPRPAASRQRSPALRRARRRARHAGAPPPGRRHAARGGHRRASPSRTPPPAPRRAHRRSTPRMRRLHPHLAAAAAEEVHAARPLVGDRGRVLRTRGAADDLRRLPGGALLPRRRGALDRAGPDRPVRRWCSRRSPRQPDPVDRTTMVDLPDDAPMRREWAVVCDAPDYPAMLTAWELPGQSTVPDRHAAVRGDLDRRAAAPYATPHGPAPRSPSSSATPRRHRCSTSWPTTPPRRRWRCCKRPRC